MNAILLSKLYIIFVTLLFIFIYMHYVFYEINILYDFSYHLYSYILLKKITHFSYIDLNFCIHLIMIFIIIDIMII